jgi:hypothetical protein
MTYVHESSRYYGTRDVVYEAAIVNANASLIIINWQNVIYFWG